MPGWPDRPESWPPSALVVELGEHVEVTVVAWAHCARPPFRDGPVRVLPLLRGRRLDSLAEAAGLRPQVVHAFWAGTAAHLGAAFARRHGVPLLVSVCGGEVAALPELGYGDQRSLRTAWRPRLALSLADGLAVASGSNLALTRALAPGTPASLLSHGCSRAYVPTPRPPRGRAPRLVAVGSLLPVKRPGLFLETVARLPEGTQATWWGEGPLRAEMERRTRSLGLTGRIRWAGHGEEAQLVEALREADLMLHPSAHEGECAAVLEALSAGRPVVAAPVGAAGDLLTPGFGRRVEGSQARQWADAVMQCWSADEPVPPLPFERSREGAVAAHLTLWREAVAAAPNARSGSMGAVLRRSLDFAARRGSP